MNPVVSINIPTYNSERTIEICLKAIKKQTYKNFEIIIIDGNSKDKTLECWREGKQRQIHTVT
jgi:glycosyltransferase involved in cell wall biosynthesis